MAKELFKSMETNRDIEVTSKGMVVLFPEPTNPKIETVLKNHSLDFSGHISSQLEENDITDDTLILTMNENLKKMVIKKYPDIQDNTYTLKEFVGETGEVIDPCGGTLAEYEACYKELSTLVKKTVYKFDEIDGEKVIREE